MYSCFNQVHLAEAENKLAELGLSGGHTTATTQAWDTPALAGQWQNLTWPIPSTASSTSAVLMDAASALLHLSKILLGATCKTLYIFFIRIQDVHDSVPMLFSNYKFPPIPAEVLSLCQDAKNTKGG